MAVRPLDYGDQNPSDIGDVAPVNPVLGYSEGNNFTSYRRKPRTRPDQQFVPDQKIKEPILIRRNSFTGIVLSRITAIDGSHPIQYKVLRQDGRVVTTNASMKEGIYCDYRAGDNVQVNETQKPDIYAIIGEPRQAVLECLEVTYDGEGHTNTTLIIPFNEAVIQTGNKLNLIPGAGISIDIDQESALFEVNYKINISSDNISGEASEIYVYNRCFGGVTESTPEMQARGLVFQRSSGFIVSKITNPTGPGAPACLSGVWLQGGSTNFMPYQPAGGGRVRWSGDPQLAGSFKIGTQLSQSWLKIVTNGNAFLWLGNGNSQHVYRFPDDGPQINSYLRVKAWNGSAHGKAIQLEHSSPGASGIVKYHDCYDVCQTFTVEKGIIVSGFGLQTFTQAPPVIIVDELAGDYDPC